MERKTARQEDNAEAQVNRLVAVVSPLLADGRAVDADGVPLIGRATRKKAEAVVRAVLAELDKR